MSYKYQKIYKDIIAGKPAFLELEAEGVTYVRRFAPAERLILLGGGNVSQALCPYAADLGFDVTVVDDRPDYANAGLFPSASHIICDDFARAADELSIGSTDYVAVLTRGHRYDAMCLRSILKGPFPGYLGMIGSKRRVAGLFQTLENEGFKRADLDRIHAPIGLPIAALTVREIAVSIAAELIFEKRKDTPRHSGTTVLTEDGINLLLLNKLAFDETPGVLMTVLETEGSTPVKSGAMMIADSEFRTIGTIGGGCSEHSVLVEARKLIGTCESKVMRINMGEDTAEEGMACGGQMKVLIQGLANESPESPEA